MLDYRKIETDEQLADAREAVSTVDQCQGLAVGCETWGIMYGSQRGQMSRWPDGRGAVCVGGDSHWGEWRTLSRDAAPVAWLAGESVLVLDDDGAWVTEEGEWIDPTTGEALATA